MDKEFKTIKEQINILKSHGIIIDDENRATKILEKHNYYYIINGYKELFLNKESKKEKYLPNVNFEEIYALYKFDKNIKYNFLKYILIIENQLHTYIAYEFSRLYGCKDYLKEKNFNSSMKNKQLIKKLIDHIKRDINHQCVNGNKMLIHYNKKYKYIPLWIVIRILTFGSLSIFYSLMKQSDQSLISKKFCIGNNVLKTYLSNLAIIRNICAHDEKLYDIRTKNIIHTSKYHKFLKIKEINGNYVSGKNDLFAVVIIFKLLLEKEEFKEFYKELIRDVNFLKREIKTIDITDILENMGFPNTYKNLLKE